MPYPNEHAARLMDPGAFDPKSFRRIKVTAGVSAIIGRLTGQSSTTTQSYRFDKSKFTPSQARAWCKSHDVKVKLFEPAEDVKMQVAKSVLINRKSTADWKERNPQATKAKDALRAAIKSGKVKKPSKCSKCGSGGPLEAHHVNYNQPLRVLWLCTKCHSKTKNNHGSR